MMNKSALTIAFMLAAGSAYASQDAAPVSVIENPAAVTFETQSPNVVRFGDAALAGEGSAFFGYASTASTAAAGDHHRASPRLLGGSN